MNKLSESTILRARVLFGFVVLLAWGQIANTFVFSSLYRSPESIGARAMAVENYNFHVK